MNHIFIGETSANCCQPLRWRTLLAGTIILTACTIALNVSLLYAPVIGSDIPFLHLDTSPPAAGTHWIRTDWMPLSRLPHPSSPGINFVLKSILGQDDAGVLTRLLALCCHLASSILVWLLARQFRFGKAFLAAMLFALHPFAGLALFWCHRVDMVMALPFILAACLFYLRFLRPTEVNGWNYPMTVMAAVAALLITPDAIGLPLILALVGWWRTAEVTRKLSSRTLAHVTADGTAADPDMVPNDFVQKRRAPDELERHEWEKLHPLVRQWLRFNGSLRRSLHHIGLSRPAIFRTPWAKVLITLLPIICTCIVLASPHFSQYTHFEIRAPECARLSPPLFPIKFLLIGWLSCWIFAIVPLSLAPMGNLLPPIATGSLDTWLVLVSITILVLLLLPVVVKTSWAHGLALLTSVFLCLTLPTFIIFTPQTEESLVVAEKIFYWGLPILAILVAALFSAANKWVTLVGGILVVLLATMSFSQIIILKQTTGISHILQQQAPYMPLGITARAQEFAQRGLHKEAVALYEQALTINPAYAPAWNGSAQIAFQQQDYYLAEERFAKALQYDPENPNYRLRLLETCRRWNPATKHYDTWERLINDYPAEPEPHGRQAVLFLTQHLFVDALRHLDEAVAMTTKNPDYQAVRGLFHYAVANHELARRDLQAALHLDPHNQFARFGVVWMRVEGKDGWTEKWTSGPLGANEESRLGIAIEILGLQQLAATGNQAAVEAAARKISLNHPGDTFAQIAAARILLLHPNSKTQSPQIAIWILGRAARTPAFKAAATGWVTFAIANSRLGNQEAAMECLLKAAKIAETSKNTSQTQRFQSLLELSQSGQRIEESESEMLSRIDFLLYVLDENPY